MAIEYPSNAFQSSGKWYRFSATLFDSYNKNPPVDLQGNRILEFDYVNALNSICLNGTLKYDDVEGKIVNYLNVPYPYLTVILLKFDNEKDAKFSEDDKKATYSFMHTFIVNNIHISDRKNNVIAYELKLTSINYYNYVARISYSNYDLKPLPVLSVLADCLVQNANDEYYIDKKSFNDNMDDVKINYVTNGNDNAFSVSKYLLNKLFYYKHKDDSMKFLQYDETDNAIRIVNLVNLENKGNNIDKVVMSMFKGKEENMLYEFDNNLATAVKFPTTSLLETMKHVQIGTYNHLSNLLSSTTISKDKIVDYHNLFIDSIDYNNMLSAIPYDANKDLYVRNETYWNNSLNIYENVCNKMFYDNALIVNTAGDIQRKPGNLLYLSLPNDLLDRATYNEQLFKAMNERFKRLEGIWISSKVHHYISTSLQYYYLNITMFRNFALDQK